MAVVERIKGKGVDIRSQSEEARGPTLKNPAQAIGSVNVSNEMHHAVAVGARHDAGLDDVDGARDGGGNETGDEGGGEVSGEVVLEGRVHEQQALGDVVAGELAGRHEGGAGAVGPPAAEPAAEALLAGHADHAVHGVPVVPPLGGREGGVVLHADVDDVGKVARDAAHHAGAHGQPDESRKRRLVPAARDVGLELLVDAEPHRRVRELPEERGRETVVETFRAVGLDNVHKRAAHRLGRVALAHLKPDLPGEKEKKKV